MTILKEELIWIRKRNAQEIEAINKLSRNCKLPGWSSTQGHFKTMSLIKNFGKEKFHSLNFVNGQLRSINSILEITFFKGVLLSEMTGGFKKMKFKYPLLSTAQWIKLKSKKSQANTLKLSPKLKTASSNIYLIENGRSLRGKLYFEARVSKALSKYVTQNCLSQKAATLLISKEFKKCIL